MNVRCDVHACESGRKERTKTKWELGVMIPYENNEDSEDTVCDEMRICEIVVRDE